jgi:dTMP kinase
MFISIEGPEGSGKSSQIPQLATFLREQGHTVYTTREPGGTPIGDQVREVLMSMRNTAMSPRAETLLFCAARAQLVHEVIRPRVERREVVISDRYADSTLAYQGYGHGNDLNVLRQLLQFATGGLWPDLTLLLDLPVETGLNRKRSGGGEWNRLDAYEVEFHRRVRQGFLEMAKAEPRRWRILDATQPRQMVQLAMRAAILECLANPGEVLGVH